MVIKYGEVEVICDEDGMVIDYVLIKEFLIYGNDNEEVDVMVNWILDYFMI